MCLQGVCGQDGAPRLQGEDLRKTEKEELRRRVWWGGGDIAGGRVWRWVYGVAEVRSEEELGGDKRKLEVKSLKKLRRLLKLH